MTPALLEVDGLSKSFGQHKAIDGVSFSARRGEVVCIIGPSGCGKSTLLRSIVFLEPPDSGFVRIGGVHIGRVPVRGTVRRQSERELNRLRPRIGFVFQDFQLWPHLSLRRNLTLGPEKVLGLDGGGARMRADTLLARFGLADRANAYPAALSGGERQRAAIARALAMQPELLLFDEPTSALDPELIRGTLDLLRDLAADGATMLVVTHELGFAAKVADRVLFMIAGRVIEEGAPGRVLTDPQSPALRWFLDSVLH